MSGESSELDWPDKAFQRDRKMWWRIGFLLQKAAVTCAENAAKNICDGDRAMLLAEAASYANHMATGEGDWTSRARLFSRTPKEPDQ